MLADLRRRALTLDSQHPTIRSQQRHTPATQLVHRGHRTRRHHIHRTDFFTHTAILRPTPDHSHVEIQFGDHFVEEFAAAQQRLDQSHIYIWPGEMERDAGKAGAAADIGHSLPCVNQFAQHRTVEDVTFP
ncbi:hypothetical protein EB73_10730 [Mycobacterium sp. SWH-M3]|nr:hypothetical protein EB73_10730 [Mycobacterium sp. SWH-M3]